MKPKARTSSEYEKFKNMMTELLKVPHSEIKAKLDAEKRARDRRRKLKKASEASGRASGDKD